MLHVSGVAVRYSNGALGVRDVSLAVASGSLVALLGPNGAGKTTTARGITGFLRGEGHRVVKGRIELDGRDITNVEPHRASARGVSYVPERKKVFPNLSVAENLMSVARRKDAPRSQIFDRAFTMFPLLGERRAEAAGRLSGGQQQMLAIARALVQDPKLLVVDEPTLGLHVSLIGPLFETLRRVAEEGAAVLVTEEASYTAVEFAEHCYVISNGRVVTEGAPAQFQSSDLLALGYLGEASV